jgi:hypothetical protein
LAEVVRQRASQPRRESLSNGQERIWRLLELDQKCAVYNLGFAYDLKGPLDVAALEKALENLSVRRQALRSGVAVIDGVPMQVIVAGLPLRFERVDLSSLGEAEFVRESRRLANRISTAPIDLANPPLWRFTLLERTEYIRSL